MLQMMENEMSKGRSSGGSSNAIEMMLEQITNTTKNIIVKRAEILENADKYKWKEEEEWWEESSQKGQEIDLFWDKGQ